MKKLKAFTLAEVLIVIAIIGIIATLTLPTLNNNIMKNMAATGLAKAINDLESANKLLMEQNHLRNLTDHANVSGNLNNGQTVGFRYFEALGSVMELTEGSSYTYYPYGSGNATTLDKVYTSKNNISYILSSNTGFKPIGSTTMNGYSGNFLPSVVIDVNGIAKGPNKLGKDVFMIDIDSKGIVIPVGSKLEQAYNNDRNDNWETQCIKQAGGPANASYCAGAIADNGYKVLYY